MKEIFDPQKAIEDTALAFPICEYCFGDTAQLPFPIRCGLSVRRTVNGMAIPGPARRIASIFRKK